MFALEYPPIPIEHPDPEPRHLRAQNAAFVPGCRNSRLDRIVLLNRRERNLVSHHLRYRAFRLPSLTRLERILLFICAMPKYWMRWLTAAGVLAATVLLDEWLETYTSALLLRLALIAVLALVAVRFWPKRAPIPVEPQPPPDQAGPSPDKQMMAEIATALEHLRSVGLLLEISETHRQPLPRVVPLNLELVIKHLEKARQQFTAREQDPVLSQRISVESPHTFPASE